MRLRTLSVAVCSSLAAVASTVMPAVALAGTGVAGGAASAATPIDASVAGGVSPTVPSPIKPARHAPTSTHHAPITAATPNIAYSGPVYEKMASGQVVPYAAPQTAAPGQATSASATGPADPTGGSPVVASGAAKPDLLVPGHTARIIGGFAAAPMDAPAAVQEIIWSGNQIVGLPYIFGGGHASFVSPGYDCSGTVSFALHGASLLSTPMDSTEFETWQSHGVGTWVTVFANGGHAYMTVAGVRLDTSSANDPSNLQGPRWRPLRPENVGFVVRHPQGL